MPAQRGNVLAVDGSGGNGQPVWLEIATPILGLDLSVQRRADLRGFETGHDSAKGVVRDAALDAQKAAMLLDDLPRSLLDAAQ